MQVLTPVPIQRFSTLPRYQSPHNFQKPNIPYITKQPSQYTNNATLFRPTFPQGGGSTATNPQQGQEFDGKRLRKSVVRKTVDYNPAVARQLVNRIWQRDSRDYRAMQPDCSYYIEMTPPTYQVSNPINAVTTKFVRTSTNKMRCPIFSVAWTPEGRRLVTGASSGEFTLWNGLTFNFETILQAHDAAVRSMVWSHNDTWMVTGDHSGYVKYWQSNMNQVRVFQAHKDPVRGISFCPTDQKFASCSDDGTVRIWDFYRCIEEKSLRGHGADVKCVAWHPHKGLIVSGSKDSQQPIKIWDPRSGQSLATIHAHKSTVMDASWNANGNWLLTASRDHLVKLFDVRKMSQEVQTFRGHKKEVASLAWHPYHEGMFVSGGSDGSLMFWVVGADKEVGGIDQAHDGMVWSLAWHPLGHILCSGSNDHTSRFWTRNRPGDKMRDKFNNNNMSGGGGLGEDGEMEEGTIGSIPGMGIDQTLMEQLKGKNKNTVDLEAEQELPMIPGLDFGIEEEKTPEKIVMQRKVPYSKPIPRQFQQSWMDTTNKRPPSIYRIDHSGEMADDHPTGPQHGMKGPHDERHFEERGPPISGFGDSDLRQMGDSDLREPPNLSQGPMGSLNHSQGPMGPSNHHQGPMGPPSHLKGQMGPPNELGPPPIGNMGPPKFPLGLPQPQNSMGPPLSQRGPPSSMGPPQIPPGQMGPPQGQMRSHPPPMGNDQDFLHPMGPPNMFQGPSQRTSQAGGLQRPPMGSRPPIRQQHDFPDDNDYGEPLTDRDMRMMGDDFHRKRDWDVGPGIDEREFQREDFPNEDFRPDFNQGGDFRDEGEDRMFGGQRGGRPGRSRGRGRGRARGRGRGGGW